MKSHLAIILAVTVIAAIAAAAGPGGGFDLDWRTTDGGGGTSTGGAFEMTGTIGQPDAGAVMTGGDWTFVGGFWGGAVDGAPPCPPDTNGDGVVDVTDLVTVILAWGGSDPVADINDDGVVDVGDLVEVILAWGMC